MQPRRKSVHTLFKSVLKGSLAVFSFTVLAMLPAQAEPGSGRTVKYSPQDIVSIRAKIRFSTLIVLPPNEDILDFATGDKEFWIINGVHNLCYVHPAKAGIRRDRKSTRLNSSHPSISYAVFCLKKKTTQQDVP